LAHILERVSLFSILHDGGCMGIYSGDVAKLLEDIQLLKPTSFVGVPRVFQKIYDRVMTGLQASSSFKRWLFHTAYESKKASLRMGYSSPLWDFLIFSGLSKRILGGQVKIIFSGSAPLSAEVRDFLRIVFTPNVREGYGLTETCAGATLQLTFDPDSTLIGPPIPCAEIKLMDVPEMNYYSTDHPPRGEICIRGPCVSPGYYRNHEKTAEVFEKNGWFHTGDVGQFNENGTFSIIDRSKNIFKLSHGEYIAPEKLEIQLLTNVFISQIFVYGDSREAVLLAVVIPEEPTLANWATKAGLNFKNFKELCALSKVHDKILEEIATTSKQQKFRGFEMIKEVMIDCEPFSIENDLVTPTMKLKRIPLRDKYKNALDDIYRRLPKQ